MLVTSQGMGREMLTQATPGQEQSSTVGQSTEVTSVNTSGQAKPTSLFHQPFSTFRTTVFYSLKSQECRSMQTAPFFFPGPSHVT